MSRCFFFTNLEFAKDKPRSLCHDSQSVLAGYQACQIKFVDHSVPANFKLYASWPTPRVRADSGKLPKARPPTRPQVCTK